MLYAQYLPVHPLSPQWFASRQGPDTDYGRPLSERGCISAGFECHGSFDWLWGCCSDGFEYSNPSERHPHNTHLKEAIQNRSDRTASKQLPTYVNGKSNYRPAKGPPCPTKSWTLIYGTEGQTAKTQKTSKGSQLKNE